MPDDIAKTKNRWPRWAAAGLMAAMLVWLGLGHFAALYWAWPFPPIDSRPWGLLHDGLAFLVLGAGAVWYASTLRPRGTTEPQVGSSGMGVLCLMAAFAAALASTQLTLGMVLRYIPLTVEAGVFRNLVLGHLVNAGVLTTLTVMLAWAVWRRRAARRAAGLLLVLLGLQLLLGAAMWVSHFYWPAWAQWLELRTGYTVLEARGLVQAIVVAAHATIGGALAASLAGLTFALFQPRR